MEVPGELGQRKCASLFTGTDKQAAERKRGLSTYRDVTKKTDNTWD